MLRGHARRLATGEVVMEHVTCNMNKKSKQIEGVDCVPLWALRRKSRGRSVRCLYGL